MGCMIRVSFFQELAYDGTFEQGLVIVLERWYQTAWIEIEQRLGLVVWVDLNVLVGDSLFFQYGPGALYEGAAWLS